MMRPPLPCLIIWVAATLYPSQMLLKLMSRMVCTLSKDAVVQFTGKHRKEALGEGVLSVI